MRFKRFAVGVLSGVLLFTLAAPQAAAIPPDELPDPAPGFRVLPYLNKPASDQMTIAWVSETRAPGTITVTGPSYNKTQTSDPVYLDVEYTANELAEEVKYDNGNGVTEYLLPQGSWLWSNSNYRHSVTFDGLQSNTVYNYTVLQDDIEFNASFKTAPTKDNWDKIRVIAFSDTETEPLGRLEQREWELSMVNPYTPGSLERPGEGSVYAAKHGHRNRYGAFTLRYPMTQDRALTENMRIITEQNPDLLMIAGDLTQGAGKQPAWDEFFRYFAGEVSVFGSYTPILPSLGNWETYSGSVNGGYCLSADDCSPAVISRNRYHDYWDTFGDDNNPQYKDSYYRVDHGPLTIITLDSTNGVPDENNRDGTFTGEPFEGDDTNLISDGKKLSTDTQGEFTYEQYKRAYKKVFPGSTVADVDLPNFNPGTEQWKWAEAQLKDARAKGQVIIVQWHHAAYSSGVHGAAPNFFYGAKSLDNQSGVAMRVYTPMLEEYGVAAVIAGHDEMFERSFVDENGDGIGFHSYDVGVAADGLRGELYVKNADDVYVPLRFNTFSEWSASADVPETWVEENGLPILKDGGLHYGHLQMDLEKAACGGYQMTMTPVYIFPVMDSNYDVVAVERRVYDDVVTILLDKDGKVVNELVCETPKDPKAPKDPKTPKLPKTGV